MKREEALKVAKPIPFNTEMVRAIQDGRKTVTRQTAFPNKDLHEFISRVYPNGWWFRGRVAKSWDNILDCVKRENPCRYRIGDILYVQETWCKGKWRGEKEERYFYKADAQILHCEWRPSTCMPKEAARIFLRVTDIRVERLQNITEEQAIHEGIEPHIILSNRAGDITEYRIPGTHDECPTARGAFSHLWNSTVKKSDLDKYGWAANPWVWVIEFEKLEVTV